MFNQHKFALYVVEASNVSTPNTEKTRSRSKELEKSLNEIKWPSKRLCNDTLEYRTQSPDFAFNKGT